MRTAIVLLVLPIFAACTTSGALSPVDPPCTGISGFCPGDGGARDAGVPIAPAEGGSCASALATNICPAEGCSALPPTCSTTCTPLASVQFHLIAPPDDAGPLSAVTYSWGADAVNWFSVSSADGGVVQVVPPTSDNAPSLYWSPSCSVCQSLSIAPVQIAPSIGDSGITGVWNGTSYSLTSTCDEPQNGQVPCGDVLCAAPGNYVVKMCASPPGSTGAPQCVSVPFDFPGTPEVTGTLGQ